MVMAINKYGFTYDTLSSKTGISENELKRYFQNRSTVTVPHDVAQKVYDCVQEVNKNVILDMMAGYSTDVIPIIRTLYSYVFVDSGSHQDGLPMQEVKLLENIVVQDGIIAFHDFDSQFKEVREAYDYLVSTGKYEPININWQEIVEYVNANNLEDGNNSWHHTELKNPCFIGAVKRK